MIVPFWNEDLRPFRVRILESLLYGVSAGDPMTQVLTVATLLAVAVGAAFLPVTRSLRLDPMESLRAE